MTQKPLPLSTAALTIIALSLFLWVSILFAARALAQTIPSGQPITDSALAARALTKSDTTVLIPTRGVYIGDAAACDAAFLFVADTSAVTFTKIPPGYYRWSVIKLMSTNTACTAVIGLW